MSRPSPRIAMLIFGTAFWGSLLLSTLSYHIWPRLPDLLTIPVIVLCGMIPPILLFALKHRSLWITLPTTWLVWMGLTVPLLLHPEMVTETTSGCWASGCDVCLSNAAACGPQRSPATFGDMLVYAVIGGFFITVGSLLASGIRFIVGELRASARS